VRWTNIKKPAFRWLLNLLTAIVLILCVFPFFWTIMTSVKTRVETIDPSVWVFMPVLENYRSAFRNRNLLSYLKNSSIIVASTTAVSLALGTLAAYGFARFKFRRKEDIALWILSLRMLPPITVVIPLFLLGRLFGLLDKQLFLVIIYLSFNIPFTIWMMRGFIEEIPQELEEAAWVDGCSRFQGLLRIVGPVILPGITATAIFCVIQSWNEFTLAFFLTSFNSRTVPTMVTIFLTPLGTIWGEMAAVGVVAITPILVFSIIVQRYLIRGLTFGSLRQ
jgi:multiple sugar transport system permease protein